MTLEASKPCNLLMAIGMPLHVNITSVPFIAWEFPLRNLHFLLLKNPIHGFEVPPQDRRLMLHLVALLFHYD